MTASREWRRFVRAIQERAPRSPVPVSNAFQQAQSTAGDVTGGASALVDGLGRSLPEGVGPVAGLVTASSPQDLLDGAIDEVVNRGAAVINPEAGLFVGNGLAVLRGALRAVERSDRIEDYLNQLGGYTDVLARCAIDACFERLPYATVPQPAVPSYANHSGRLYSGRTRASWIRGHARCSLVIQDMDRLRPTHGDWYSKIVFIQLFLNATGMEFVRTRDMANRMRTRIEEYVLQRILFIDVFRRATNLRRWGNTG